MFHTVYLKCLSSSSGCVYHKYIFSHTRIRIEALWPQRIEYANEIHKLFLQQSSKAAKKNNTWGKKKEGITNENTIICFWEAAATTTHS